MDEKKKAFFVRVPEEIYREVERIAKGQQRSFQSQTAILLGNALNRSLVNPEPMEWKVTQNDDGSANVELKKEDK